MRGLPSFCWVFGDRAHFSNSLPLLDFVKNMLLWNPSLYPYCSGGGRGVTPWLTCQVEVKASTCGGADVFLLDQQFYEHLASADSLQTDLKVHMDTILSVDESLWDLGIFAFVPLYLFYVDGSHLPAVAELLRLIAILEKLHTKVKETI